MAWQQPRHSSGWGATVRRWVPALGRVAPAAIGLLVPHPVVLECGAVGPAGGRGGLPEGAQQTHALFGVPDAGGHHTSGAVDPGEFCSRGVGIGDEVQHQLAEGGVEAGVLEGQLFGGADPDEYPRVPANCANGAANRRNQRPMNRS